MTAWGLAGPLESKLDFTGSWRVTLILAPILFSLWGYDNKSAQTQELATTTAVHCFLTLEVRCPRSTCVRTIPI